MVEFKISIHGNQSTGHLRVISPGHHENADQRQSALKKLLLRVLNQQGLSDLKTFHSVFSLASNLVRQGYEVGCGWSFQYIGLSNA